MKPYRRKISAVLIAALVFASLPAMSFAAVYDDAPDDIKYSVSSNKAVNFSVDDFNDVCDDLTDDDLDYVKFKLPDEDEGVLYYDYDTDKKSNTEVDSSRKYYCNKSPYLKRVTFVPDEDFSGTVTIRYTGFNEEGDSYTGKIKITVKEGSNTSKNAIKYSMSYKSDYVKFNEKDFLKVCKTIQSRELDYVMFSLPDKSDGILYYDYDDRDSKKVSSSRKYYYDESPSLSKIAFVPDDSFSGTLTIKYTGYDVKGDSYTGKITITVGEDEDSSNKRIKYTAKNSSSAIKFDEDDFNDLCDELNGRDLDYVMFTIPSSSRGVLYYNYSNGQYSSVVTSSKKYYMESSPYLGDVTFLPKDQYTGTFAISFEGRDVKGNSFSGEIAITVGSGASSTKAITYSGKANTPTLMKDSDFNSVCKELLGNQLSYVTFSLPSSSYGDLYYGYTQDGEYSAKVREGTKYYYDGSPYLLNVAFVPARGFSGTATISYTGYDVVGLSYNGTVQVSTSGTSGTGTAPVDTPANTPVNPPVLVSSKYFSDVDTSYSWAVPYIDSLYEAKVISGSTATGGSKLYSPATNVTRGDFMLLLYRALNMKTTSKTTGFSDVPSGSYYYTAINTAKALGIAQGSDNYFYPDLPITREDAMVFVQRAVNIVGKTIPAGETESLKSFKDYHAISDYSTSAVAALVKAGIITGSDDNMVYPKGNLTRAQVAAIIHRVINR